MYTIRTQSFIKFKKPEKTISVIRAEIDCDTETDLPAVDAISGTELYQGSTAWVIGTGDFFALNSSETWIKQ